MPDLNLQEEGSLESMESSGELGDVIATTEEPPAKKGGGMGMVLVVVLALALLGGGAFVLNKLGVVHLWGKKPAPAVVQLPEQRPTEQTTAQATEQNQTQMIETPPVDEKSKAPAKTAAKKGDQKSSAKPTSKAAPKPEVKEMPAPAATNVGDMKGEYTVQVSAWRDKGIADEMVKRLGEAGYPAFVEDRAYKGGTWYTVRIGRYASRKEAASAIQNFAEELKTNYWIDKVKSR
jgi:septal ring-binding cell division protein DamX